MSRGRVGTSTFRRFHLHHWPASLVDSARVMISTSTTRGADAAHHPHRGSAGRARRNRGACGSPVAGERRTRLREPTPRRMRLLRPGHEPARDLAAWLAGAPSQSRHGSGPSAEARQQDATRWISLVYLPDDDAQPEAPLFQVAVLLRSDWIRQSMKSSLAAGVEVATDRQLVAIASLQAVNPYPPDSHDADIFDALLPRIEEISRLVQFAEASSPRSSRPAGRGATGRRRSK